MPFQMTRCQFSVRLAYALTINKFQGQSVKFVGVDLHIPVFSYWQLIESKNLWSLKGEIRLACFDGNTAEHWLSTSYYVLFDI
ncbi:hypothetical protein ACSBR2_002861 [Camellia fascicularis]